VAFAGYHQEKEEKVRPFYEKLIIKECYCQNGHNLVSSKVTKLFQVCPEII